MSDTLWDASYPPSVLHPVPPVIPPTGVVAGAPGTFTPAGCTIPANLAALKADPVVGDAGTAKPSAAWTEGQYVALGDASQASWDGTAWVSGAVPPVVPEGTA